MLLRRSLPLATDTALIVKSFRASPDSGSARTMASYHRRVRRDQIGVLYDDSLGEMARPLGGAIVFLTTSTVSARADRFDDIAASPMSGGRPTAEASRFLKDELLFQRATQVYLWALPRGQTIHTRQPPECN